jgi:hypothetical protein
LFKRVTSEAGAEQSSSNSNPEPRTDVGSSAAGGFPRGWRQDKRERAMCGVCVVSSGEEDCSGGDGQGEVKTGERELRGRETQKTRSVDTKLD